MTGLTEEANRRQSSGILGGPSVEGAAGMETWGSRLGSSFDSLQGHRNVNRSLFVKQSCLSHGLGVDGKVQSPIALRTLNINC